jgi:CheY-like chemotaxis protein
LPCVFDRFRQADGTSTRAHGGLGLGLSLVRHLVELHGGHVRAHSPGLGRGATFTVVLPILEAVLPLDARQPSGVNDGAAPAGALVGVRVVAVDDEEDTLEFIRTTLERQGACVVTANCAEDALVFVSTLIPDVLVLDLMLPDLDGCALLEHLRGLPDGGVRGVPAVAVTAQVRAEDRARALAAGFQRCLSKPFGPRELVDNVRELAEAERTARAPLVSGLRHAPPGPPPLRDTETAEGDAVNHAPAGARAPVKAGA